MVRVPTSPEVTNQMVAQTMEVAAGVKQQLEQDALRIPGVRLLPGHFMTINQAMAIPKGRGLAGINYLRAFVQKMKSSGFVAQSLVKNGIEGASVAPP